MQVVDRRQFIRRNAAALAGVAPAPGLARAATTRPGPTEASAAARGPTGFYRFSLGHLTVTVLSDGSFQLPSRVFAAEVDEMTRDAYYRSRLIPADQVALQVSPVLLESGGRRILVDAGMASGAERAPNAARLPLSLQAAGVPPESIDAVVVTHAHVDHVGGLLHASTQRPTFPNAEVFISSAELDRWRGLSDSPSPERGLRAGMLGLLRALDGRIRAVGDDDEIAHGVRTVASRGHTYGHSALAVDAGEHRLLLVGDAIADSNVAFEHPDWHAGFDDDPAEAARTRRRLLDWAATDRLLILAYHVPFPGIGRALRNGSAFRWHPVGGWRLRSGATRVPRPPP
jgi:glyoxylase-like metal-dependent hydrolase (beta-lactamase superfamily II)